MYVRALFTVFSAVLCVAASSFAIDSPANTIPKYDLHDNVIRSDGSLAAKAVGDTILLMGPTGSGAPFIGDFEAGWNGWTSVDLTQPAEEHHWQVSGYNQVEPGNLVAWCGDISLAPCDVDDPAGGYGNRWHEILATSVVVNDRLSPATVRVTATLQTDTEPAYDYVHLTAHLGLASNYTNLVSWDGIGTQIVDETYSVALGEYVDDNTVMISFRFKSDGAWSDEDCDYASTGACQLDDISVTVSQVGQPDLFSFTDFQDGTLGAWAPAYPTGTGDFAKLWRGLSDADPCHENTSQQVAFIDDGVVVPGTGGSACLDWCYGPNGYIVNTTGGLVGQYGYLYNEIRSPVMPWPDEVKDGALLSYDLYVHEELTADSPAILHLWNLRSVDNENSGSGAIICPFAAYGGPSYRRREISVGDLLVAGRDSVQVLLSAWQDNRFWSGTGHNGTPAPYLDNVRFEVFETHGPVLYIREYNLAQDGFPEIDAISHDDLGSMHVRFDAARNISPPEHMRNDPGDSVTISVDPQRNGATLVGPPQMHYVIDPNPLFDAYRTTPLSGVVDGLGAYRWSFDLPDTGTLFPGDVMHYYFRAGDDLGGIVQYNTLPADLTGFGDFSGPFGGSFDNRFVVRALPTITDDGFGGLVLPRALVWDDGIPVGKESMWFGPFPFSDVWDVDVYRTQDPAAGVGNGLGGRTGGGALAYYEEIFYTCGDETEHTLSNGNFEEDAGNDLATLSNWMAAGDRGLFLTGDNLATDLATKQGLAGVDFLQQVMGLDLVASDLRPLIGNQSAPLIRPVADNPVLCTVEQWIAYGSCSRLSAFDAVTGLTGATVLAQFTDVAGNVDAFPYSAATLNISAGSNKVISLPYAWSKIYTVPGSKISAPLATRDVLMLDVRHFFSFDSICVPSNVPTDRVFSVASFPNPFNPATRVDYTIKAAGHLTLNIYDLRGRLVRTLLDREVKTDGHIMWDGTDNGGAQVASGVYFREARMGPDIQLGKMMLIK